MIFLLVALIALVFVGLGLVVLAWESVEARDARRRNTRRGNRLGSARGGGLPPRRPDIS